MRFPTILLCFLTVGSISQSMVSCKQTERSQTNEPMTIPASESMLKEKKSSSSERKIWCLKLKVPDGNWRLQLASIYRLNDNLFVFAQVFRIPGPGIQMISNSSACAPVDAENAKIKVYVTGKTWGWANHQAVEYVKKWPSPPENSQLIYRYNKKDKPIKPEPDDSLDR